MNEGAITKGDDARERERDGQVTDVEACFVTTVQEMGRTPSSGYNHLAYKVPAI